MNKKRRTFLALFLALAMIIQYSLAPNVIMSYAEEMPEASATETSQPAQTKTDTVSSGTQSSASSGGGSAESSSPAPAQSSSPAAPAQPAASSAEPVQASGSDSAQPSSSEADQNADANTDANADTDAQPAESSDSESAESKTGTDSADSSKATAEPPEQTTQIEKTLLKTTSVKSAASNTALKATNENLTVNINNIVNTNQGKDPKTGIVQVYTYTFDINKNGAKTIAHNGTYSYIGGGNYSTSYFGMKYKFLKGFVLSKENGEPVYWDSVDGHDSELIQKINNKGSGNVVITYMDGHTESMSETTALYITPVYQTTPAWILNHQYIDNISTGSGSWSNIDAVTEYKHTFRNPEEKSPSLTKDYYKFVKWQNDETGETFLDSTDPSRPSEFVYTGTGMKSGETKNVNIFAYWQPAVIVNYIMESTKAAVARSLEDDIDVYDGYKGEAELSDDDNAFAGWYDEEGARIAEGADYDLPEVTKEANSYKEYNVTAKWQPAVSVVYNVLKDVADTVKNVKGESIKVYDKAAESTVDGVTFEGWYDENGNRISEDFAYDAPEISATRDKAATYNVFARFATSRSVQKVWNDGGNADRIRSDSVTVQLYANGEPTGKTIVLSSANSWASAFADLDAYDKEGNLIEYTINEENIPSGYSASIAIDGTSFLITNTHTPTPAPSDDPEDPQTPAGTTGTGNPGGGGTTGGGNALTTAQGTTVTGAPVPTAGPAATTIDDPEPPMAVNAYWALINLICAILTALLSLIMLIRYFGKRQEEDEETGEVTEIKRKGGVRLASIIPAIGAIIAFILTEDMSLPMQMIDKWTLLMVIILAIQVIVAIVARKKKDEEDENVEQEPAMA